MATKIINSIGLVLCAGVAAVGIFITNPVLDKILEVWNILAPAALAVLNIWGLSTTLKAGLKDELGLKK